MFGMNPKRGGLFGNPADRYGITPGTIEERPSAPPEMSVPGLGMQAPQPKRRGLFGTGIQLSDVIGIAGDAVAINRGMQPMFAAQQQRAQEIAAKQREASMQRDTDWQDYVRKQEYEAAHPKPHINDTEADYDFWKSKLSPEDFAAWQRNRVNPPMYRQGPDGQFYPVQPAGAAPTAPVGKLTPITGGPGATPGTF